MPDSTPGTALAVIPVLPRKLKQKIHTRRPTLRDALSDPTGLQGPGCLSESARIMLGSLGAHLSGLGEGEPLPIPYRIMLQAVLVEPDGSNEHLYMGLLPHIERLAAQGMTTDQIADRLGIAREIFREAVIFLPDFVQALKGGLARGIDEASASLAASSRKGDTSATKFILQTKGGYHTAKGGQATVVVNIGAEREPPSI
jgi:hypothetical protein